MTLISALSAAVLRGLCDFRFWEGQNHRDQEAELTTVRLSRLHQGTKQRSGAFVVIDGPFRVPLHGENEVIRLGSLKSLDNAVIGTTRDDAKPNADHVSRLMMAGIHGDDTPISGTDNPGQLRMGLDRHTVRCCHCPSCLMID